MREILIAFAAVTGSACAAAAQTAPIQATPAPVAVPAAPAPLAAARVETPRAGTAVLPANTEPLLRLDQELSSKVARVGTTFRLTLAQDVMMGNYIVIPRGTPATGEVVYRTGKGAFGKSAKMEIETRSLDLAGRSIPLSGRFRQEGEGNTGATVGTAVAAGPFAAFVTGRSAVFQSGREFRAYTRDAIPVSLPN